MPSRSYSLRIRPRALLISVVLMVASALWLLSPLVHAGSLSNASLSLSDPQPAATGVTYSFNFSASGGTVLRAFQAQVCASASGSCSTPGGFSAAGATLTAQPIGLGDATGWQDDSVTGALRFNNPANATLPAASQQFAFAGVTNPTAAGPYFVRLTVYSDASYASPVDTATIALVVAPAVTVSAIVNSAITFSVNGVPPSTPYKGALTTSDRCSDSSTAVTFGTPLLPLAPDTDYDCAQTLTTGTNAANGYEVTVRNTATGSALQNPTSSTAISDWTGTNANPTPTTSTELFGYTTNSTDLSGAPDRFTVADNLFAGLSSSDAEVARAPGPVAGDSVNVGFRLHFTQLSPAGSYTGKIVYTCTATF